MGNDNTVHLFKHPFIQSCAMFLGLWRGVTNIILDTEVIFDYYHYQVSVFVLRPTSYLRNPTSLCQRRAHLLGMAHCISGFPPCATLWVQLLYAAYTFPCLYHDHQMFLTIRTILVFCVIYAIRTILVFCLLTRQFTKCCEALL